jgi:hypothetical protein
MLLASDPDGYLSTEEAAMLRAELIRLAELLEAAGIIDIPLAQLAAVSASATRH